MAIPTIDFITVLKTKRCVAQAQCIVRNVTAPGESQATALVISVELSSTADHLAKLVVKAKAAGMNTCESRPAEFFFLHSSLYTVQSLHLAAV